MLSLGMGEGTGAHLEDLLVQTATVLMRNLMVINSMMIVHYQRKMQQLLLLLLVSWKGTVNAN
mgnify:CR=1 FL=1